MLDIVKNYFMLSTYTWMLGEGSYLQLLLINTWRVKKWQGGSQINYILHNYKYKIEEII